MNRRVCISVLTAFFLVSACSTSAGEPAVDEKDLPRIPPTDPDKALATFRIKPGFQIELVASEPMVLDPIAMAFDENGKLFVVEMRDYSERRGETPHPGRIRLLEDTDGDGRFDRSTVFVDDLPWPTAVFSYDGGIFVGATPDIVYCKDTGGDGVADVREKIFTGFASDYAPYETNRLNVQAMLNSLNWGLDNRIHGATSLSGGKVSLVDSPFTRQWIQNMGAASRPVTNQVPVDLRGRDFSFDPRTLEFRAETGGGQHGLSFNSAGRKFVCSNSSHIQALMYEERYSARNPVYSMPRATADIAVDGPSAEVFRISPDEPWRVIRTQWRLAGLVPGPVEGGGRPSGYFTGATGITLYRGDAFPEEYHDNAFVADCGSNLIHRKRIVPDESAVRLVARRPDDEQKTEFLASTDIWFRPVQMANAPDGALYIADMYREVIEHPWSLPAPIKALLDLNSGNDRGRIYRIVPERFKQPKPVRLGSASLKQLVDSLESRNGWHRDTAARLLYQRQDQAAVPMLQFLLEHSSSAAARLHALYALDGMTSLRFSDIVSALGDPDGAVRIHALRILEKRFAPEAARSDSLILPLGNLSRDADPFVAYQLAFTLGDVAVPNRAMILTEILQRHPRDPWVEAAVLSSLNSGAGELVLQLMLKAPSATGSDMQRVLVEAAGIIGAQIDSRVVTNVFESAFKNPNRKVAFSVVAALEAGLQQSGKGLARTVPQKSLDALVTEARSRAADRGLPEAERESAVHLLGIIGDSGVRDLALTLIGAGEAEAIQSAAVRALARGSSAGFANLVLERWSKLPPQVRTDAILSLLTRSEWTRDLLAAIERGEVARSGLSAGQLQSLRTSRDATTRQLVVNLFGEQSNAGRQEVVNAYYPALKLPGDANRGKAIYLERCASCHRSAGQGQVLGPDFATVKSSGKEMLLVNILDPNRQVAPSYLDYAVETKDGRMLNGILAAESAVAITLRGPNGVETVLPRPEVSRLESLGRSLMPDGLEAGLKPGQLADLLEYIVASKE